jgi:hypothetical protein
MNSPEKVEDNDDVMMMKGGMGRAEEPLEDERFIDAECHKS